MEISIDHLSPEVQQFIQTKLAEGKYNSAKQLVDTVLGQEAKRAKPMSTLRKPTMGIFEHLGIHVREKDIREMREEAWKNFPRDIS